MSLILVKAQWIWASYYFLKHGEIIATNNLEGIIIGENNSALVPVGVIAREKAEVTRGIYTSGNYGWNTCFLLHWNLAR